MAISLDKLCKLDNSNLNSSKLEDIEIQLLLSGILQYYGFDFREYTYKSLKERLFNFATIEQVATISALQDKLLHDPKTMERFLQRLSIGVTSLFRDPTYFLLFRKKVVPILKTYPFLRIWTAGCATGEEAYSLAILLYEEGLYKKTQIYATDLNENRLQMAKAGTFNLDHSAEYERNYRKAGGTQNLSTYYYIKGGKAYFAPALRENITFAQHNLTTDQSFNEFQVIFCRNVLLYFSKPLQDRVHKLMHDSLTVRGFLGLGNIESIDISPYKKNYEALHDIERLYRRLH